MFEIGFNEFLLVLVVGLIVLGPKRLPETAKWLGQLTAKSKKALAAFKEQIDE